MLISSQNTLTETPRSVSKQYKVSHLCSSQARKDALGKASLTTITGGDGRQDGDGKTGEGLIKGNNKGRIGLSKAQEGAPERRKIDTNTWAGHLPSL